MFEQTGDVRVDAWERANFDANVHAVKELGPFYQDAVEHFGGAKAGGVLRLLSAVKGQLADLHAKNVVLRDSDGKIITGLLDLKKLGLTDEQIKDRRDDFSLIQQLDALKSAGGEHNQSEIAALEKKIEHLHFVQEARLHAAKELGMYYHNAVDALGEKAAKEGTLLEGETKEQAGVRLVQAEAESQLRDMINLKIPRHKHGRILTGLFDLERFGLTQEQQAELSLHTPTEYRYKPQAPKYIGDAPASDIANGGAEKGFNSELQVG